jgi:acyl-CoA synthetase (AMP-forming)/AMP-acid ligase II
MWKSEVQCNNLVELLNYRAQKQPYQVAYTFLLDGETQTVQLTYQQLQQQAQAIATQLQSINATGERALLLYPPGLEYIIGFFGCLYAGVVAVPAYPPRINRSLSRLQAIVTDSQATIALTTTSVFSSIKPKLLEAPELQTLRWLTTDTTQAQLAENWHQPQLNSDTLAFLQYTSGSTGQPKGVMVTHGNLLYNECMIQQAYQHDENTIVVGWLPIYHDMGLIGNVLQPLYLGTSCYLMSPMAFLQKPWRWLQAISRYGATTSGGPNFAYDLCVNKVTPEQIASLDLSSWEVAFNGAEPIRAETLARFAAKFAPCGFRPQAFYPCYGMAEATLLIPGRMKTSAPVVLTVDGSAMEQNRVVLSSEAGSKQVVGCGHSWLEEKIAIAHPETFTECSPEEVGEIWVSGANVAAGYWERPEETQQIFHAYLADRKAGPFLRTGDLGFIRNGELFVTGRLKDLIIIDGCNHYPQDIEKTVENSHSSFKAVGAFSVNVGGEEKLVILAEVERSLWKNPEILMKTIKAAVSQHHDLQVYAIALVKPGGIPRTSSGKIQRHACRQGFLNGSLNMVHEWKNQPLQLR